MLHFRQEGIADGADRFIYYLVSLLSAGLQLAVFFGGDAFVFSEDLGEIAALPEAAFHAHGGNGDLGAAQEKGGLLDPVEVYIIHR